MSSGSDASEASALRKSVEHVLEYFWIGCLWLFNIEWILLIYVNLWANFLHCTMHSDHPSLCSMPLKLACKGAQGRYISTRQQDQKAIFSFNDLAEFIYALLQLRAWYWPPRFARFKKVSKKCQKTHKDQKSQVESAVLAVLCLLFHNVIDSLYKISPKEKDSENVSWRAQKRHFAQQNVSGFYVGRCSEAHSLLGIFVDIDFAVAKQTSLHLNLCTEDQVGRLQLCRARLNP